MLKFIYIISCFLLSLTALSQSVVGKWYKIDSLSDYNTNIYSSNPQNNTSFDIEFNKDSVCFFNNKTLKYNLLSFEPRNDEYIATVYDKDSTEKLTIDKCNSFLLITSCEKYQKNYYGPAPSPIADTMFDFDGSVDNIRQIPIALPEPLVYVQIVAQYNGESFQKDFLAKLLNHKRVIRNAFKEKRKIHFHLFISKSGDVIYVDFDETISKNFKKKFLDALTNLKKWRPGISCGRRYTSIRSFTLIKDSTKVGGFDIIERYGITER